MNRNGEEIIIRIDRGRCIECASKLECNCLLMRLLTGDAPADPDDERRLDLFLEFIEDADFPALRASSEDLSGIKDSLCLLRRGADGTPCVSTADINNTDFYRKGQCQPTNTSVHHVETGSTVSRK
jgi:hypothetical protein